MIQFCVLVYRIPIHNITINRDSKGVCVNILKPSGNLKYQKPTFLIGFFSKILIYSFFKLLCKISIVAITERIYYTYTLSMNINICQVGISTL